jgi:formylglycine-generating enzyme required for sulfatase activity
MGDPDQPPPITVGGVSSPTSANGGASTDTVAPARAEAPTVDLGATGTTLAAPQESAAAKPPPAEMLGYRLVRQLGAGGMGLVYEAHQDRLKRTVALKLLKPEAAGRKDFIDRFLRESKAMAAVSHPNVVGIFDAGEHDGYCYMALEFVPGGDLAKLIKRRGALAPAEAIEIAIGCARGLAAIAAAGLVHRDIKPQNIFLDRDLKPKIGDLGLARAADGADRMTMTGAAWGTPVYMSPEHMRGVADIDARSDIYALGATLFTALTGEEPFSGQTTFVISHKVLNEPTPDPRSRNRAVPPALAAITMKAMAKYRDERYESAEAMIQDLERARDGKPLLHCAVVGAPSATTSTPVPAAMVPRAARAEGFGGGGGGGISLNPQLMKIIAMLVVVGLLYAVVRSMQGETHVERPRVESTAATPADHPSWAAGADSDAIGRFAVVQVGPIAQRLRWIPAGSFAMGSPEEEPGRDHSETRHHVTISSGFWLAETEVTRALWHQVMGGDSAPGEATLPMTGIDADDCRDFLAALAKRVPGLAARLPSEAEWEYACRAGSDAPFSGGTSIDGRGWAASGSLLEAWRVHAGEPGAEIAVEQRLVELRNDPAARPRPVAQAAANAWGLYDMHGNAAERCADAWDGTTPLPAATETDPLSSDGALDVARGGAWFFPPERCRSAARIGVKPAQRSEWLGMRILVPEDAAGARK